MEGKNSEDWDKYFTNRKGKKLSHFLCGLHEVYSHIMASSDLFIYLYTRVERLSRGLAP